MPKDLNQPEPRFTPENKELKPLAELFAIANVTKSDIEQAIEDWVNNPPEDEFQFLIEASRNEEQEGLSSDPEFYKNLLKSSEVVDIQAEGVWRNGFYYPVKDGRLDIKENPQFIVEVPDEDLQFVIEIVEERD